MTDPRIMQIIEAAQAVLDRWNSPKWEWAEQGPTADLMADLRAALTAARSLAAEGAAQAEPIAWRSTTVGYRKFITQAQYERFSPAVRKWYEPYHCANCVEGAAQAAPADSNAQERFSFVLAACRYAQDMASRYGMALHNIARGKGDPVAIARNALLGNDPDAIDNSPLGEGDGGGV